MSSYIFLFSICLITIMVSYTTWVNYDKFLEWQFAEKSVEREMFEQYYAYLSKFNKRYRKEEFYTRIEHFKKTLEELSRLEAIQPGVYGLNKFSDMSEEERQKILTPVSYVCYNLTENCPNTELRGLRKRNSRVYTKTDIPDKLDWRDRGVVSKVLNQRRCHACWAMSIVGVMESMAAIKFGYLVPLSSQELIDCSEYNNGCNSGEVRNALDFLCTHDFPIVRERDYPLTLINEECRINIDHYPSGLMIKQFTNECDMDEDKMLSLIANHGPIVVVVNAKTWVYYTGGVIQRACDNSWSNMDHVVQIVGYDLTSEVPYYIVRNSWGDDFGLDGYLKLAIKKNMCGVANNVAYFDVVYK